MSAGPHGIYPMLYAFFGPDGRLDRQAMRRQVQACLAGGAHGIAALGLATEVSKLSEPERLDVLYWLCEDTGGRVPIAITVYGETVEKQSAFVAEARSAGVDWVILQPPPLPDLGKNDLIGFFGAVADEAGLPVAVQNAPEYLRVGLSPDGLAELNRRHPAVSIVKGEGPAVLIEEVIRKTDGELTIFNGRGGLELPDNLRAGCAGMIPAPDCFDVQVRIFELMRSGDEAEAERLYAEILPAIVFVMQSIDHLLCYGKRLAAARVGLEVFDRDPGLRPTDFGLECTARFAEMLGSLSKQ